MNNQIFELKIVIFTAVKNRCILVLHGCVFVLSRFGFEGGIWVLVAPVLCHCLCVASNFQLLNCISYLQKY